MSVSITGSLAIHYAGHFARRSKPHQFIRFGKTLFHHSSNDKGSILSTNVQNVFLKSQYTITKAHSNIETFSPRLLSKLHYSSIGSNASWTETGRGSKGLILQDSNAFSADTFLFHRLPGQQLRFISNQEHSKGTRVLFRKGAQNLRNSRRNSEKVGEKAIAKEGNTNANLSENPEEEEKKLTLYQRFKKTYKEHGKVLVAVHVATSVVWFSTFYAAASLGFDIVPLLESWNMSERVIAPFRSGGLGNVALAYLLYKLATPARYTVTIAGTRYAIGYLQKEGRMKVVPKADSLRSLYNEGKEDIKGRSRRRMTMIQRKARARRKQRNSNEQSSEKQ